MIEDSTAARPAHKMLARSFADGLSFLPMCAFTRRRFWIALRYRLGVLGVCLAYALAALEVPLPVFVHKISGQPFPCQDHACGCQTAEQCWSHCCCFTAEERWAWAREHNVEPPAYAEKQKPVENPAPHGWNTAKLRDRDSCAETAKSCCCRTQKPETPTEQPSRSWMTMMTAWRCQGYATLWISIGAVLPILPLAAWSLDDAPPSRLCLASVWPDIVPFTPPDPPPRLSLV